MNDQEVYKTIVDYLKHSESSVIKNNWFFMSILSLLGITHALDVFILVENLNITANTDLKWSDLFTVLVCSAWYLSNKFYDA